jgi:hypothetical protein
VSFVKRLALFVLILAAMIFFFGLFPVVAQSAPLNAKVPWRHCFKSIQAPSAAVNNCFIVSIP